MIKFFLTALAMGFISQRDPRDVRRIFDMLPADYQEELLRLIQASFFSEPPSVHSDTPPVH